MREQGGRVGASWRARGGLALCLGVLRTPLVRPASCVAPVHPQTDVLRELERLLPVRSPERGRESPALCLAVDLKLKRTSSFRGVSVHGRRWKARLKKAKKVVFCKVFETEIEAAEAYDAALTKVWGDTCAHARTLACAHLVPPRGASACIRRTLPPTHVSTRAPHIHAPTSSPASSPSMR